MTQHIFKCPFQSMPASIFETTEGAANFHQNLKNAQETSTASFSYGKMENEHKNLRNRKTDDTLDISVISDGKHRLSIDTISSDLLSEHPKSQSSPSKTDESGNTTRNSFLK